MEIIGTTIWREARGEGHGGMIAVAKVIKNRATDAKKRWPTDPEHVCLQRRQFSCWNDTDANRETYPAPNDQQYLDAVNIWGQIDTLPDATGGATFYLNPQAVAKNPFDDPQFNKTAEIGKHWFYVKA